MKISLLLYLVCAGLLLSGCDINLPNPLHLDNPKSTQSIETALSDSKSTLPVNIFPSTNPHTNSSKLSSSFTLESDLFSFPQTGIISESSEYLPGNPKSHSTKPVARDLSLIIDNTREEDEVYRPVFAEYMKSNYPEHTFRIVNITNFQINGTTYKKAQAYAAESTDISMFLYYDGIDILDSFHQDVILRQNTMNRWRRDFRQLLDPLTREIIPLRSMNLDVSYNLFEENIAKIHLDESFNPDSDDYQRALILFIQRDGLGLDETVAFAATLLETVQSLDYYFDTFYLHHQEASGEYVPYQIPGHLINSQALHTELANVLSNSSVESLIKPIQP